jgi:catechol 2,3-dioxygenase-like lactoylglutathione lyase family enzyme
MTQDMAMMKIGTIILHVPDVAMLERCRDWYRDLGVTYDADSDNDGESYWFETGGVSLGIHTGQETGWATLYFNVADVDERYAALRQAGFVFEAEPATKFWGRVAYLRDPAGNTVGLVAPSPPA